MSTVSVAHARKPVAAMAAPPRLRMVTNNGRPSAGSARHPHHAPDEPARDGAGAPRQGTAWFVTASTDANYTTPSEEAKAEAVAAAKEMRRLIDMLGKPFGLMRDAEGRFGMLRERGAS
jgi:hypothetical protein